MKLPEDWEVFDPSLIQLLKEVIEKLNEQKFFPNSEFVLHAFELCKPQDIKVIILGQDPYHQPNQANGLSFSVKDGVKIPPSLKNIFAALKNDMDEEIEIRSSDLSSWAKQGVFLLNRALTVIPNQPNSHSKIWNSFTEQVIQSIAVKCDKIVYLLWGKSAHEIAKHINPNENLILKTVHPSPLSAYRGFLDCKHFSKANDYLVEHGKQPVDWNLY